LLPWAQPYNEDADMAKDFWMLQLKVHPKESANPHPQKNVFSSPIEAS
jgi:hypothetical protein